MTPPFFVFIATSLDGYIARKNNEIDWLNQPTTAPGEDHGYNAFISRIDTIVMGRGTFEKVTTFDPWPYENTRVIVLSQSMSELPDTFQAKAELHRGSLEELLPKLAGAKGIYIDGGKVIQSFLRLDLVDEMTITQLPVLLGAGMPLFGELHLNADQWWDLTATHVFPVSGIVQRT